MARMALATPLSVTVLAAGLALGCSSSSPAGAGAGDAAASSCGSGAASFQSDVMVVFAANCSTTGTCHGQMNNSSEEDLYLGLNASEGVNGPGDVAAVHAGLVGMKSSEDPSMNLVTPGDLENSYLWHKVVGDQNTDPTVVGGCQSAASGSSPCSDCISGAPCGAQMPLASTLDLAAACAIENWIMQGAKND